MVVYKKVNSFLVIFFLSFNLNAQDTINVLFEEGFKSNNVTFYINDSLVFKDSSLRSNLSLGYADCAVSLIRSSDGIYSLLMKGSQKRDAIIGLDYFKIILIIDNITYECVTKSNKFIGISFLGSIIDCRNSELPPEYE